MPTDYYLSQLHATLHLTQDGYYTIRPQYANGQPTGKYLVGTHTTITTRDDQIRWVGEFTEAELLKARK